MRKLFLGISLASYALLCSSFNSATPSRIAKAVYAHLEIRDTQSAIKEAERGLEQYPHEKSIWMAYIKALAKAEDDKKMLQAWETYQHLFPEERLSDQLLESIAWGVLENGSKADSPAIRIIALVAAFLSQDAKGLPIIQKAFYDPNSYIRKLTLQLAGNLRDEVIRKEVYKIFQQEKDWHIHQEAIKAVGAMKIQEARPLLVSIIASDTSSAEEKAAAIQSLVLLLDSMDREEIRKIAANDRAGLRLLACEVVAHFDQVSNLDLILPLVSDNHADVRAAALGTLGYLRGCDPPGTKQYDRQNIANLAVSKLKDPEAEVAIMAAWLLTLNDPLRGQKALEPWLADAVRDNRILASAALAASGRYGFPLTVTAFYKTQDPYVKMNLAMGMIGQRIETEAACDSLYEGLAKLKEKWDWEDRHHFNFLSASKNKHDEDIPQYPEELDQMARLEVLNMLAILKYPKAQIAIKKFLQEKNWGITGLASALLLTEGDETALDIVQALLDDPDFKVRVQAALTLALWGRGENAIETLQNAYPQADRDMKDKILEGLLKVGSANSIPFLVERLKEPSQSTRLIAAAGLLICLNH